MCHVCRRVRRIQFALDVLDGLRWPLVTAPAAWNLVLCQIFDLPLVPLWLTLTSCGLGAAAAGTAYLLGWWTARWLERERAQAFRALVAEIVEDLIGATADRPPDETSQT